jgi:hypothetical protein
MTPKNSGLQDQIDAINEYSLVSYIKLLGYTPTYINEDFAIFDIPVDDAASSTLVVKNSTNRFRLTMMISNGGVLDLASLLFRAKPEEILADIAPYKLDQLMSADPKKDESLS